MLKALGKYWPLVALALAVIFTARLLATPVGSECDRYNTKANHQAYSECIQDASTQSVAEYTKVLAALTLVLAVVGSAQIFYVVRADDTAAKTAQAAKASADVAERTLFYANRSYIDISRMHNEWNKAQHPQTGEVRRLLRYRVGFINRGTTPAVNFNLSIGTWQSLTPPTLDLFDGLDRTLGQGYVSRDQEVLSVDFFISEQDIRNIYAGKEKYWVFIHIAYRDVFDDTPDHVFQDCRELVILADPDVAWDSPPVPEGVPDILRWIPFGDFTKST